MDRWNELFIENKKLDDIYVEKYSKTVKDYHIKNCMGFIIELGEFVNETKCFKYWTIKKTNMDDLLEELADCFQMILCLYHHYGINNIRLFKDERMSNDLITCINDTFRLSTELIPNGNKELCETIFNYLYHISKLLELKDEDILDACFKKIEKNKDRLASDY